MVKKLEGMELEEKILELKNELIYLSELLDLYWGFHPQNKDFVNPIVQYEKTKISILELKKEIFDLELKAKLDNNPN